MRRPQGGCQLSWESHGRCPKSRTNHEAFAARWFRGESRHGQETRRFTQVSAPLCLEVNTYSCVLLLRGPTLRLEESAYRLQWWWLTTFVSRRSRLCCKLSSPNLSFWLLWTSAYKGVRSRDSVSLTPTRSGVLFYFTNILRAIQGKSNSF